MQEGAASYYEEIEAIHKPDSWRRVPYAADGYWPFAEAGHDPDRHGPVLFLPFLVFSAILSTQDWKASVIEICSDLQGAPRCRV